MSVPRLTKPNLLPPPSPLKKIAFEEHFGSVKNLGQPACRSQVDQPG